MTKSRRVILLASFALCLGAVPAFAYEVTDVEPVALHLPDNDTKFAATDTLIIYQHGGPKKAYAGLVDRIERTGGDLVIIDKNGHKTEIKGLIRSVADWFQRRLRDGHSIDVSSCLKDLDVIFEAKERIGSGGCVKTIRDVSRLPRCMVSATSNDNPEILAREDVALKDYEVIDLKEMVLFRTESMLSSLCPVGDGAPGGSGRRF